MITQASTNWPNGFFLMEPVARRGDGLCGDAVLPQPGVDGVNATLDSKHAMGMCGALLLQKLGTATNKQDHVASRENASNVESCILSKAVTNDCSWFDTPRRPHASKCDLDA